MNCVYSMFIQWSDEDQVYVVTLPEFPRCRTHGSTYAEAAMNGQEVLEILTGKRRAGDRPLPEPLTLQELPDLWKLLESSPGERRHTDPVPQTSVAVVGGHEDRCNAA